MDSLSVVKKENVTNEIYYDEPMDTYEAPFDSYCEEGEINSSDEEKTEVRVTSDAQNFLDPFAKNDEVDKDEAQRKLYRAKRFSLPVQEKNLQEIDKEQISNLYRDLGIDKENERHYRFNAIHMRGTENMSTEDVFDYFNSYNPSYVEWINDVSCNVIWVDDVSAARALWNLSKKIKNLDKIHLNADPFEKELKETESIDEDMCDGDSVDARQIKVAIPPGFWRIGTSTIKSPCILLRYATRSDKKQRNAERNSEYYKKYGNPHYGNLPGIFTKSLRSGARKHKPVNQESRIESDSDDKSRQLSDNKNPWKELAYEWGKTDAVEPDNYVYSSRSKTRHKSSSTSTNFPDLRISLRNKKERRKRLYMQQNLESSQNSSDQDTWECRSKVPRMKMYADDEEKRIEKNLDRKMQKNKFIRKPVQDLRSKITKKKDRPRFKFRVEKKKRVESSGSELSASENEYDDGDSGDWALEEYHDLRDSLGQRHKKNVSVNKYPSESENNESDADDLYKSNFGQRSPLQIEIDNDEYYLNK